MVGPARRINVYPIPLHNLIAEVANGNYRIPRFQRKYVWAQPKINALFDSMYREFPIGSFFIWKAGRGNRNLLRQASELGIREVADDDDISFVLDGQQRLTSLYVALNGLTVSGVDYSTVCFDLLEERFVSRRVETRSRYIPVCEVWRGSLVALARSLDEKYIAPLEHLDQVLKSYPVSIVEVRDKSLAEVCDIFQRINQSGQRLDRFDLVSAMTFSVDFDLRERFHEDIDAPLKETGFGSISPTSTTQLLALIVKGACTESNEYSLTTAEVHKHWKDCVRALLLAADVLRKNMGVISAQFLPYEALLTLLAYFLYISKHKLPSAKELEWLKRWFWRSAFGQRYSSAVATQMGRDKALFDDLCAGALPDFNHRVELTRDILIATKMTSTASAIRNGFLCLLATRKPLDLLNGGEMALDMLAISKLTDKQKHHIFPWAFLRSSGMSKNVHSVANFCFLSGDLNRRISGQRPSQYFQELSSQNNNLDRALDASLIPTGKSGLENDDYPRFLDARSRHILDEVRRVCGQSESPRENERHIVLRRLEKEFRNLIDAHLRERYGSDYWHKQIPEPIRRAINQRMKADGTRFPDRKARENVSPRQMLDYCMLTDYTVLVSRHWPLFEEIFGNKQTLQHHMDRFGAFRNKVAHGQAVEGVALAEGEAAIAWLASTLPTVDDPASLLAEEAIEEEHEQDDDGGFDDEDASLSDWTKRMLPSVSRTTHGLIKLALSIDDRIAAQARKRYIGFSFLGTPIISCF